MSRGTPSTMCACAAHRGPPCVQSTCELLILPRMVLGPMNLHLVAGAGAYQLGGLGHSHGRDNAQSPRTGVSAAGRAARHSVE